VKAVKRADAAAQPVPAAGPGHAGPARRRARALAAAGAVLVAAGALAGCSTRSPATITTPYAAADGVNVDLGDIVALRDVLVVGEKKGGRGAVVGTVVNRTDKTVVVELAAQLGPNAAFGQSRVSVPPNGSVLVGPGSKHEMLVDDLPVGPGEVIEMSAASADAGATYFKAPVLAAQGQYESLTPPPTTEPPTPTGTPSASGSESATGEPTGDATSTEEATPTEEPTGTP
jgi:hypothetical protein